MVNMATSDTGIRDNGVTNLENLTSNLNKIEDLTARLTRVLTHRSVHNAALDGPNQELYAKAIAAYWNESFRDPAKVIAHQLEYWSRSVTHFIDAQAALAQGKLQPPSDTGPADPRFSNELWDTHPYFNFIKQQYLINVEAVNKAVEDVTDLEPVEKQRLRHFSKQIVDMMAPTNFLATNPDALEKAVSTEGESLIQGIENLISDLEANNGELVVRLADESAFELGKNVATSPGKVVYRNRMMELIQFSPSTETVHETPLLIFPPWINKYYILDLKEKNSLVKWIVDQGYTLFIVSWVNPDASHADIGMEDYVTDGFLRAIEEVKTITAQERINVVGYCIAGTTLSLTLSYLKQQGDKSIKSATFFTALTDFADQGEFTPFLQNDFVDGIEKECEAKGVLPSVIMARTFSFLRANDLIYRPAIRSYMMGETPPAFDLLYWNGDGANLPAKMAMQYLRGLCQRNEFAEEGFELMGHKLKVSDVDVPLMAVTCETDHIAAWRDCYRGVQKMKSRSKAFIVSQSGHIAGIVNPPSRNKYGHYTNSDLKTDATEWFEKAEFTPASWWPVWEAWLTKRSGKQVPARVPGDSSHPVLGDAPGTYVRVLAKPL